MVSAGFACETLIVVYLTVLANNITRVCPSRCAFQMACADPACLICSPGYFDCNGLLKMHAAGGIAYEFILQMPSDLRTDILTEGNGLFFASDINWNEFHRDGTKSGLFNS